MGAANGAIGISSALDSELQKDYQYFVQLGELRLTTKLTFVQGYTRCRQLIDWEKLVQKYNGSNWSETNSQGMSPQERFGKFVPPRSSECFYDKIFVYYWCVFIIGELQKL